MSRSTFIPTRFLLIALALIGLVACDPDDDNGGGGTADFDRQSMLTHLADELIVPAYTDYHHASRDLDSAAIDFTQSADLETLESLRQAWETALRRWQKVGFYKFGPAMDIGMGARTNGYPVDPDKIAANIASGVYNLETAANIDAVGLQALDFLLFGTGSSDQEVLSYFENTPGATAYLTDLTDLLAEDARTVYLAWTGEYRDTFVQATGTNIGSSTAMLVNGSLQYLEVNLRDAKIGIPAGARISTGEPLPDKVEARYNGTLSKELLTISIEAWRNMFNGIDHNGVNGPGFDDYIAFLGTDFDADTPLQVAIDEYLEGSLQKCEPLDPSLATAVVDQQMQALEVFDELQRVVVLVKVDMTSAMGIQITFVDNDGD